jgi:hypothetical protein
MVAISDGVFSGATAIRILALYNNQLQNISSKAFQSLKNAEQIFLHGNLLTSLDPSLFISQEHLGTLSLQDNMLTSVDVELLKPLDSLTIFNLSGNPLVCDCVLRSALEWWSAHKLDPWAACQHQQAKKTVAVRWEQLENVPCVTHSKKGVATSTALNTHIQAETFCDVITLVISCLIFLIIK